MIRHAKQAGRKGSTKADADDPVERNVIGHMSEDPHPLLQVEAKVSDRILIDLSYVWMEYREEERVLQGRLDGRKPLLAKRM